MKTIVPFAAIVMLALGMLGGCSKDDPTPTGPEGSAGPLMPLTDSSTWSYSGRSTYTLTVTGDSTIAGTKWKVMRHSIDGILLMRKDSLDYYAYDPIGAKSVQVLRDADSGTTWMYEKTNAAFTPARYEYRMMERNMTLTVNSKEYKNVVHVHLDKSGFNTLDNTWHVTSTSDQYYARGTGLVREDFGSLGINNLVSSVIR